MEIKPFLDVVSTLVTILGLPVLIATLALLIRQLRLQTYQAIYESVLSIDLFFSEHSDLRPYINDGKPVPDGDSRERNRVMGAAETLLEFFEHLCGQRSNMSKAKWMGWREYMRDVYVSSPAMRRHLETRGRWYTAELLEVVRTGKKGTGQV